MSGNCPISDIIAQFGVGGDLKNSEAVSSRFLCHVTGVKEREDEAE